MKSIKKQLEPKPFKEVEIHKSAGILDDYSIRKATAAREAEFTYLNRSSNLLTIEGPVNMGTGTIFCNNIYTPNIASLPSVNLGCGFYYSFMGIRAGYSVLTWNRLNGDPATATTTVSLYPQTGGGVCGADLGQTSGKWRDLFMYGIANINTMAISTGSITDTTGTISFGDENLTTTGDMTAGNFNLGSTIEIKPVVNWAADSWVFDGKTAGRGVQLRLMTKDGDGTDNIGYQIFGYGAYNPTNNLPTNFHRISMYYALNTQTYRLNTDAGGDQTAKDIIIAAGSSTDSQLFLKTDGNVGIGKDPTTDLDVAGEIHASGPIMTDTEVCSDTYYDIDTTSMLADYDETDWEMGPIKLTNGVKSSDGNSGATATTGGAVFEDGLYISGSISAATGVTDYYEAAYATGTTYNLTTSMAKIDFGTTDPMIDLDEAGTYMIDAQAIFRFVTSTYSTTSQINLDIRRTNNTAAYLTNSAVSVDTGVLSSYSGPFCQLHTQPIIYTTANTDDHLELWAQVADADGGGNIRCSGAAIRAIRIA